MCRQHPLLFHSVRIVSVLFVLSVALFVKASYYSHQETIRGDAFYERLAYREAITHYERAVKWYTPLSRSVEHAVERLWDIGALAEQHADLPLALEAYRTLRGSLYAVRSFYLPYQSWIPKCEEKIAVIMASIVHSKGGDLKHQELDRARFAEMLQRKTMPYQGGVVLTEIGFLGWVGATIGFIWNAFGDKKVWRRKQSIVWGCSISILFVVWIIGMLLA